MYLDRPKVSKSRVGGGVREVEKETLIAHLRKFSCKGPNKSAHDARTWASHAALAACDDIGSKSIKPRT